MNTILQDFKKYLKRLDENIVTVSGNKGVAIKDINFYSTENDILNDYKEISPYFESDFKNMLDTVSFIQDGINEDLPSSLNSLNETKYFTFLSNVIDINEESNLSHNQKCIEYIKYKLIPHSIKSINEKLILTLNETKDDLLKIKTEIKQGVETDDNTPKTYSDLKLSKMNSNVINQLNEKGLSSKGIIVMLLVYLFLKDITEYVKIFEKKDDIFGKVMQDVKAVFVKDLESDIVKQIINYIGDNKQSINDLMKKIFEKFKKPEVKSEVKHADETKVKQEVKSEVKSTDEAKSKTDVKQEVKSEVKQANDIIDSTEKVNDEFVKIIKELKTSNLSAIKGLLKNKKGVSPVYESILLDLTDGFNNNPPVPLEILYTDADNKKNTIIINNENELKNLSLDNKTIIQFKANKIVYGNEKPLPPPLKNKDDDVTEINPEDVIEDKTDDKKGLELLNDKTEDEILDSNGNPIKPKVSTDGIFNVDKKNDIFKFLQQTFKEGGYISDLTSDNIFCKIASYVIAGKIDDKNGRVDIKEFTLNGTKITVTNKKQFITFTFKEGVDKTLNVIEGKIETLSPDDIKKIQYDSLTSVTLYGDKENILNILSSTELNGEISPEDKDKLIEYTNGILKLDTMEKITQYVKDKHPTIKPIMELNFESEKYYKEYENVVKIWRNHIANITIKGTNKMLYDFNESFIKRLTQNTDEYKNVRQNGNLKEGYTEDKTNRCLIITNSGKLLEVPMAQYKNPDLKTLDFPTQLFISNQWQLNIDKLMKFFTGNDVKPINEKILDPNILNEIKKADSKLKSLEVINYDKDTLFSTSFYIDKRPSDIEVDNETKKILTDGYDLVVKTQSEFGKVGLKIYNELVTYKEKQEIIFSGEPEDDKTIEEKLNGYIILNINTVKDIIKVIENFKGGIINFKFNNYLNKENQFEISDTDKTIPLNWEGENIGENSKLGGHGKIGYVFSIDKISKLKLKNLNGYVSLSVFEELLTRFTSENETKDSTEVVIKFLNAKDVDKKDETTKDETQKDVKLKVGRIAQRGSVTWQLGSIQQVQVKETNSDKIKVTKKFVPMSNSNMVFGITYQHTPVYEILPEQTLSYIKKLENTNIDGRLYYINSYYYYGILPFVSSNTKLMSIFQSRTPKALNFLNALRSYQKIEGGGSIKEDEGKNFIKLSTKVDGEVEIEFEKTLMYKYYEHIDKKFLDDITSLKTTDAELQSKNATDKITITSNLQQTDKLNMLKRFIIESYKFFTAQIDLENNKIDFDSIIDTKGKSLKYIQNALKVLNDNDAKSYTKIAIESLREVIRFCKKQQSKKASEDDTSENQIVNKRNTETIKSLTNVIDKIRTLHMKGNEDLFNTQLKTYITFLESIEFYISNYKDSSPFERNITSDHFYTYPIKTDGLLKILGDTLGDYSILFAKVTSSNRVIIFSNNKSKMESDVKRVYIDIQHMKGDLRLLTSLLNALGGGFR